MNSRLAAAPLLARIHEIRELAPDSLILCGEPLIHPEIDVIVNGFREAGLRVELLTNGLLLKKHAKMIVEQCHALRVSLDGPPAIHNQTRGHNTAFERLRTGLRAMLDLNPDYDVQARCAVHSMNFRYLPETVRTARSIGLKGISFSAMDIENAQAFQRHGHLEDQAHLLIGRTDLDELASELKRFYADCVDEFESGFITDAPANIDYDIWRHYAGLAGREDRPTPICDAPWTSAILEHDGTLRPCFPMPAYGKLAPDQSLRDMLNASDATHFREQLRIDTDPRCFGCVCPSTPAQP